MEIQWKIISEFPNYKISNEGKIYSISRNKMKNLTLRRGYYTVRLSNIVAKTFLVHRLITTLFIPNLENKTSVNHKDGNKLNNKVSNLEWCTNSENISHAYKNKLNKGARIRKICKLDNEGNVLKVYDSMGEAARTENIGRGHLSAVCCGKRKTTGGFRWKYFEEKAPQVINNEERKPFRDSHYEIDRLGNIYNRITEKYLAGHFQHGERVFYLRIDNKKHRLTQAQIIAETFIEKSSENACVTHKDGDKLNNDINNLEWVTRQEINNKIGSKFRKAVLQYDLERNLLKEYPSIREAGEAIGIKRLTNFSKLARNRTYKFVLK